MLPYHDINTVPLSQMWRCAQGAVNSSDKPLKGSAFQNQWQAHGTCDFPPPGQREPLKAVPAYSWTEAQHSVHIEAVMLLLFCSASFPRNSCLTSFLQPFPSDLCHCLPIVFLPLQRNTCKLELAYCTSLPLTHIKKKHCTYCCRQSSALSHSLPTFLSHHVSPWKMNQVSPVFLFVCFFLLCRWSSLVLMQCWLEHFLTWMLPSTCLWPQGWEMERGGMLLGL